MKSDPRIDAYIAKAPSFARAALVATRARIHRASEGIDEDIKWNVPFFLVGGKILASLAAFKQHLKIGVWAGPKPTFFDVRDETELPSAAVFEKLLQTALTHVATAKKAPAATKVPAAKKAAPAAKKAAPAAKKAAPAAKKAAPAAKKAAPAKKAAAKQAPAKKRAR